MRQELLNPALPRGWQPMVRQVLACVLALLLANPAAFSQSANPVVDPPASPHQQLQIQVLSKTPLTEPAGTLSAAVLRVRVVNQVGQPVPRATVSFRLPEAGPGGAFLNGLSSEIAIADASGEAAVQGFDWRGEPGVTFVHVIAAYGSVRAGAMVEVHLGAKVAAAPAKAAPPAVVPEPAPAERVAIGQPAAAPSTEAAVAMAREPVKREVPRDILAPEKPADPEPMVRPRERRAQPAADRDAALGARPFVNVKQRGGGGSKVLWIVLIAGAAAGGALAAGLGGGGAAASSGGGGGGATPPVITIGNPTITITGGN